MGKFEYVKCFWEFIDDETPILLFYEVDLENERYATRMIEIYSDKSVNIVVEEGFDFITETPIPTIENINRDPQFYAMIISSNEFESVYNAEKYSGSIDFPKQLYR